MSSLDFIVIGAQKCGTTTLYEDLRSHPNITLDEKESSSLIRSDSTNESFARSAAGAERRAERAATAFGEVSTLYSMLPDHPEVVGNAKNTAPSAKIIYIVREPVARVVSHHHHDFALGLVGPDINVAVRSHPQLLNNTRYAMQIEPWLQAYGADSVLVMRFEDYVSRRAECAERVFEFLGVPSFHLSNVTSRHNAADTKHVASGWRARLSQTDFYRRHIRPLMPESVRRKATNLVLPKAPPRPAAPSKTTVEYLIEQLWPEVERLAEILNTPQWWDLQEVMDKWLGEADAA